MADGKKTYYQVSFTSGQALAAVIAVILALGLSFFLGAKAGFERAGETEPRPASTEAHPVPAPTPPGGSMATSPETASASNPAPPGASSEEAPVFEDREASVPESRKGARSEPASAAPSRTEIAGSAPPKAAPPSGAKAAAPEPSEPKGADESAMRETPSKKPSGASAKSGFFVQVLSTSSKPEALRWKDRLSAKSYRAAVTSVDSSKGKLYRVRTGPYTDRTQAKKVAAKISADFKQKAWVAPE
jgi:cell division septation protein DedD